MKVSQIIAKWRLRADDRAAPYLYSDDDGIDFLNEAMDEACIRARLLTDSSTPEICEITLDQAQTTYQLDPRVIEVDHARIDGLRAPLCRASFDSLAERASPPPMPAGAPCRYAVQGLPQQGMELTLDRLPADQYTTLRLTVKRLQLVPLVMPDPNDISTDLEPEIARQLHLKLVLWMAHLAYDGRDADASNQQMSANYEARFERAFGKRRSANVIRKQLNHSPAVTRPDIGPGGSPLRRSRYNPRADL